MVMIKKTSATTTNNRNNNNNNRNYKLEKLIITLIKTIPLV